MEKPRVLTTLKDVLPAAFEALRTSYDVPAVFEIDVKTISSVNEVTLSRHVEIAAITMRKMQLLHVHSPLGVRTPNDVVIGLCAEINRALSSLLRTTPVLSVDARQTLVQALRAIHECGIVVGTLLPPGEIVILE